MQSIANNSIPSQYRFQSSYHSTLDLTSNIMSNRIGPSRQTVSALAPVSMSSQISSQWWESRFCHTRYRQAPRGLIHINLRYHKEEPAFCPWDMSRHNHLFEVYSSQPPFRIWTFRNHESKRLECFQVVHSIIAKYRESLLSKKLRNVRIIVHMRHVDYKLKTNDLGGSADNALEVRRTKYMVAAMLYISSTKNSTMLRMSLRQVTGITLKTTSNARALLC